MFPLGYAALALIRGSPGYRHPYRFLDPDGQDRAGVGLWILLLAGAFLPAGAIPVGVDRMRAPRLHTPGRTVSH